MKINVGLDTKSTNNAINQLKRVQSIVPKMVDTYLLRCCEEIKRMAEINLLNSGVGGSVINDIVTSVEVSKFGNGYKISWGGKAPYIEFGVGIIGQNTYRYEINPTIQGEWQYDVDSGKKNQDRSWTYVGNIDETDIKSENILSIQNIGHNSGVQKITTKGNQASLFVFNAIMDFKSQGIYKTLWQKTKKEFIK